MKGSMRAIACAAAVVLLGAGFVTTASAQDETQVVPFSDPSRPGKVELHILNGGTITVHGENRRDVSVAIRGATLVDGTGAPPLRNALLLVSEGRVVSVAVATPVAR